MARLISIAAATALVLSAAFAAGLTCFPAAAVWEAMRARGS